MPLDSVENRQRGSCPSAFEQASGEEDLCGADGGAFGAPASLPGFGDTVVQPLSHQGTGTNHRAEAGAAETDVFGGSLSSVPNSFGAVEPAVEPEKPSAVPVTASYPQAFPAIHPEQISDPSLRAKLTSSESDPFGAAGPWGAPVFSHDEHEDAREAPVAETSAQPPVYPSASPRTHNIPLKEYTAKPTPSRRRLSTSLKSFVSANNALTQPIRGIARVAQRQFILAAQRDRARFVQEKEQARNVLNFTVRLAETMFHFGADTMDVDSAIVAICSTYGLDDVEVNVTSQSVIINYVSDPANATSADQLYNPAGSAALRERFSHTVVRVVRSMSINYASLEEIYRLIHSITEEGLDQQDAERRLKEITSSKKKYSPLAIRIFELLCVGFFTVGLGASWRAAVVAMVVSGLALYSVGLGSKLNLPSFFSMAISSGVVTAGALYMSHEKSFATDLGFFVSAPHIVAAGLLIFLPTSALISAGQDALTGYPLTAAGKFVSIGLEFLGIVVGIATSLTIMSYFNAATIDIQQTVFSPPPLWLSIAGMTIGSMFVALSSQGTLRNAWWMIPVAAGGQISYYFFKQLLGDNGSLFGAAMGAFTIGVIAASVAYSTHAPQKNFYIPGIMPLLPGLSIFRGLYSVVVDPDPAMGITALINAFASITALASGVVLGVYLVQYTIQLAKKNRGEALELKTYDR